jgi:hypothetical protein
MVKDSGVQHITANPRRAVITFMDPLFGPELIHYIYLENQPTNCLDCVLSLSSLWLPSHLLMMMTVTKTEDLLYDSAKDQSLTHILVSGSVIHV